ncbi:hypothetical protein [Ruicaihuangia caeni]|uniref:Sporulation protein n=1 Tax=Ruicaihuangia caeni TaxID=3042517 RepID=A0AAW6T6H0_9MICO|nr:hypothetical protein [Klugiella sp. YN-L-19]MDI2097748.1 hypothetical protein [Klugiella sp. YN-L-19]
MTNLIEKIAQSVTDSVGARVNYGEKQTIGGAEVVPVSLVWFGFGGGSDESEQGGGGGGGASVPVGMIVEGAGGPRFEPNVVALAAVAAPLVCAIGMALGRIIRALKK